MGQLSLKERGIDALYALLWLGLTGVLAYGLAQGGPPTEPVLLGAAAGWLLFTLAGLRRSTRQVGVVVLATLLAPLYLFELYRGLAVPGHSKATHVLALRRAGGRPYPAVFPSGFVDLWERLGVPTGIAVDGRRLLPLAGIPDVPTVYCQREDGTMLIYQSDALGFRNPPAPPGPDLALALLGDSWVQGFCVDERDTFRAQLEDLGETRSFGMDGTSALAQAAIYAEYVRPLRPRRLVWFFFEGNDLDDFLREREVPALRAYLDPRYTQDLLKVHAELARATRDFIDDQLSGPGGAAISHDEEASLAERVKGFLLLRKTRWALLGVRRAHPGSVEEISDPGEVSEEVWRELRGIWRNVVDEQRAHGGTVTFVYLPADGRFVIDPAPFEELERRVTASWAELGADQLSLSELVASLPDPVGIYSRNHLDAEGYRLGAEAIEAHLRTVMARASSEAPEPAVP